MSKERKVEPQLTPTAKPPLQALLASAIAGEGNEQKNLSVSLKIAGGLPSEAYHLDFRASGEGEVKCEMGCEMSGRKGKSAHPKAIKGGEFTTLLRNVLDSGLLSTPPELPRFLPDTLVGILEISDGVSVYRTYFAADPEQAKMQNKNQSPELEKTVNEIYRMAAKATGLRSVKP